MLRIDLAQRQSTRFGFDACAHDSAIPAAPAEAGKPIAPTPAAVAAGDRNCRSIEPSI
jgi:hypothetical protein